MSWIRVKSNGTKYVVWVQYPVHSDKDGNDPLRQGYIGAVGSGPTLLNDVDKANQYGTESEAIRTAQQYVKDHSWATTWEQKL